MHRNDNNYRLSEKKYRDDQRVWAGRSPCSADKEALTTFFFLCPQHILQNYRDSFKSSKFQVGVGGQTFPRGGGHFFWVQNFEFQYFWGFAEK